MIMQAETSGAGAAAVRAWSAPSIAGKSHRAFTNPDELQGEERTAWVQAEAAGRAAGLAAAQRQVNEQMQHLQAIAAQLNSCLTALSRPLAQLDDEVHDQIARLAATIARALLRRELRIDPAQVIGIVRETISLLPASTRGVRVLLHPEDAALVRERLAAAGPESAWSIVEDPVLSRGDCRVYTDYAQIDARLESRLNDALAALLGEQRSQARGDDTA